LRDLHAEIGFQHLGVALDGQGRRLETLYTGFIGPRDDSAR